MGEAPGWEYGQEVNVLVDIDDDVRLDLVGKVLVVNEDEKLVAVSVRGYRGRGDIDHPSGLWFPMDKFFNHDTRGWFNPDIFITDYATPYEEE